MLAYFCSFWNTIYEKNQGKFKTFLKIFVNFSKYSQNFMVCGAYLLDFISLSAGKALI